MKTAMHEKAKRKVMRHRPFRRAVLRGLGILLPPLLTVVIFLWVGSTINEKVLQPVTAGVRDVLAWGVADIRAELPADAQRVGEQVYVADGERFRALSEDEGFVPAKVYEKVRRGMRGERMPVTGEGVYQRYVEMMYLQPYIVVPVALAIFIFLMYLLGKFMAAGIGRWFWNLVERGISRLPLVRNVYSSVKQVTDFMFSENEIEYTRIVAVEYPRKGIWSLGFVTGESMWQIRDAAGEAVVSVLIPSSPMPVTGYTITVLKRETVDLDITLDQAFQFTISCGVVVPPQQLQAMFQGKSGEQAVLSGVER